MGENLLQFFSTLLWKELCHSSQDWKKCVILSTTETKYIPAIEADKEMLWLKQFFQDFGIKQKENKVHYDN